MDGNLTRMRRRASMAASLGLTEAIFASADERRVVSEVEKGLEAVEARLLKEVSFADELADVTSRYLLEAGGKRVRPTLTLLTSQLGGGADDRVITAATALEIIHLASLYHDDVMDEANMRRGVPSAQAVWGNSVAILSGDLLFARASKLIASLGEDAIRLQADTFERLCLGQLHETIGPKAGDDPIEHYIQVLADKTGSLIAAAARMGISFSDESAVFERPVEEFGEKIGVAFQLVDDIIDLSDEAEQTGKEAGTDLRAGVVTLPLLYLQRDAETDPDAAALLARIEAGRASDAPLDAEIAELRAHSATARTLEEAHRWAREGEAAIAPLPDGPVKKALTRFAESVVERSS